MQVTSLYPDRSSNNCEGPRVNRGDQQLSNADHGKTRQMVRNSATRRNQNFGSQDSSLQADPTATERMS